MSSFTEAALSQEFSPNLGTSISPLWTIHEDERGEISQKRAPNIYRVLFWTGPALKVLNMGLVPPNKRKMTGSCCVYAMQCMFVCETPKSRLNTRVAAAAGGRVSHHGAPMGSHQTKTEPSFTQNSSPLLAMMMRMMILTIMLMMTMSDGTDSPLTQNLLFSPHGHRLHSDDQHRHLSPLRSWIEEGGGWN